MGLTDRTDKDNNSLASEFYASGHNIDEIIAADGSIVHGYKGSQRILYVQPGQYHKEKIPEGFKRYTYKEGKLQTEIIDIGTIWEGLYDKEYDNSEDLCTEKKQKSKK